MPNIDRKVAANLWDDLEVVVENFTPQQMTYNSVQFLGYASLTFKSRCLPDLVFRFNQIEVKVLRGNPHIDFPSYREGQRFYPYAFPLTGELRAVLTTKIFQDKRVAETIVVQRPQPGPFRTFLAHLFS